MSLFALLNITPISALLRYIEKKADDKHSLKRRRHDRYPSKWILGESPDSVDKLIAVLETYALDPRCAPFVSFDNFSYSVLGIKKWRFSGNFLHLSHVFNITVDEVHLAVALSLAKAIKNNVRRFLMTPRTPGSPTSAPGRH